jgi:hypothetical protein
MPKKNLSDVSRSCYCVTSPYNTASIIKLLIFHLESRYDPRILQILVAITVLSFKPISDGSFSRIKQPNLVADRFPRLRIVVSILARFLLIFQYTGMCSVLGG